jgi:hypothetical protein
LIPVGRGDVFGKVFELTAVEQIVANQEELDLLVAKERVALA